MHSKDEDIPGPVASPSGRRLSYKFERLRERIRAAIEAGELAGKLPGERSLARQFNVNAKTLSKALTDLAAEGVLQRNIGLGTFVRDAARDSANSPSSTRILLLVARGAGGPLTDALRSRGLDVDCHVYDGELPPSLVAPYDLVLVATPHIDDDVVRNLIVRGKSVVTLDREPRPYSTHALISHTAQAAMQAAIDLSSMGHHRLLLVQDGREHADDKAAHHAVSNALPQADVRLASMTDAAAAARDGFTAAVCSLRSAPRLVETFGADGLTVPSSMSVMAYGRLAGEPPCCGRYVTDEMIADAVVDLLRTGLPHRPLTLWLTGQRIERGTTAPPGGTGPLGNHHAA